jgi:hypothetical protein
VVDHFLLPSFDSSASSHCFSLFLAVHTPFLVPFLTIFINCCVVPQNSLHQHAPNTHLCGSSRATQAMFSSCTDFSKRVEFSCNIFNLSFYLCTLLYYRLHNLHSDILLQQIFSLQDNFSIFPLAASISVNICSVPSYSGSNLACLDCFSTCMLFNSVCKFFNSYALFSLSDMFHLFFSLLEFLHYSIYPFFLLF